MERKGARGDNAFARFGLKTHSLKMGKYTRGGRRF